MEAAVHERSPDTLTIGREWLKKLLGTTSFNHFFERYWERQHLFVRASAPGTYEEILSLPELDAFLSRNDVRYPTLKIVKSGRNVPLGEYSRQLKIGAYTSDGLIDMDLVADAYRNGGTVVVQLMEKSFASVAAFSNALGSFFLTSVAVHGFLTPPGAQGLGAHYDTASAFLIQLRGSKRWRFYGLKIEAPAPDQTFNSNDPISGEPIEEITLKAGDVVYIPRGLPHEGVTLDEESLHLTVVLATKTWSEILSCVLQQCQNAAQFRQSPSELLLDGVKDPAFAEKWSVLAQEFASIAKSESWVHVGESGKVVSPETRRGRWT